MEELEPVRQNIEINVTDKGADEATSDLTKLNTTITASTTATEKNTKANDSAEKSYKSLKTQLREANLELQKAVQIHGETSKEALQAAKAVAELNDQMGFTKDLAESLNPDQKFKTLSAAAVVAATTVQGVTAGMALFGDQSEDTEKALLKVQAAMSFADSISSLSELGDQWALLKTSIAQNSIVLKVNAAATALATGAMKLFGASANTTSTGFKVLKGAIIGTGIGALVVGVGLLINNFDKVKKVVLNLIPGLSGIADSVMSIVNAVTDFIGVTSEADRANDRLKKNAEASIALNKKFIAEHGSQIDEFTKQKIDAKNKYNEAIQEDGANQVALAEELNRELAAIEYHRGDEQRKIQAENEKKAAEQREKARLQAIEDEKKRVSGIMDERKKLNEQSEELASFVAHSQDEQKQKQKEKEAKDEEDRKELLARQLAQTMANIDGNKRALQAEADFKEQIIGQSKDNAEKLLAFAASGAIKNKQIQKAAIITESGVNIGKTVSNTATAIGQDLKLGFPANIAPIALDVGVGAASIASILSGTKTALAAVGGGSAPSASGSQQAPSRNVAQVGFQGSSENQISSAIAKQQQEQPPIKAFVVSQSVTDAQELDRKKELQNSF